MGGPPPPQSSRLKTVMVVEDDAAVREMVTKALSPRYRVLTAADGLVASEMLGASVPDLLICDVMMPRVDGFTLVKLIRAQESFKTVPVIFLTAKGEAASVVKGIQLGAKHYMQKPFSVKDLVDKVDKILR